MDRTGPNWTEQDRSRHTGPNRTNADRLGPKWTEWTKQNQSGQTERIGPELTE